VSVRRLAETQPESFAFTGENAAWAKGQIAKYPEGRQASAVIPLLWQAQKQHGGWLPEPAIRHVAGLLDMAHIRVLEVATFYTMFNLEPVGRHHVQLCGTTPCWLRGADDLKKVCRDVIGEPGHVSADGAFSWIEVECLGACCNAPMVQINEDFYEDLTAESFGRLLQDLRAGREVRVGSQTGRISSEPEGGPFTLTDPDLFRMKPAAKAAGKPARKPDPARTPAGAAPKTEPVAALLDSPDRPPALEAPRGDRDDLKRIKGVGPKIEGILNGLGIYHFSQIADWTRDNVEWVDGYLKFKGRIDRDDWISQARQFAGEGR
jgi:NADH-quinone oxidoreductase subunit E